MYGDEGYGKGLLRDRFGLDGYVMDCLGRLGALRCGMVRYGNIHGRMRLCWVSLCMVSCGQESRDEERLGKARHGMELFMAGCGWEGNDSLRRDTVELGTVR